MYEAWMSKKPVYKTIKQYLALPYTIEVVHDKTEEWDGWFAKVVELPGCMTQAERFDEVPGMIADAMRAWIEAAMEQGLPIPEPRASGKFSGKFVVRVPKALHRELAVAAEREGVSLNAFVSTTLAKAVGQH
jgi:antitoxin HicB